MPDVTLNASSVWTFNHELFVWEWERDLPTPQDITGASHTVAGVLVGQDVILIDWGTAQFVSVPQYVRFYSKKIFLDGYN